MDFGKVKAKTEVVVAIDFGTTYSGVSYVHTKTPKIIKCSAPGSKGNEVKVPTALLQTPEGWVFGKKALEMYHTQLGKVQRSYPRLNANEKLNDDGVRLYRHFKLALKDAGEKSDPEAVTFPSTAGHHHNALDLVKQSLKILGNHALDAIKHGYGGLKPTFFTELEKSDITWVLTVPAIWDDTGKILMRKAASLAGLIDDEASDKLLLALEPEGASLAVHMDVGKLQFLRKDSSYVIVDCGGGTVDITAHKVESVNPLELTGLIPPTGGLWGGTFVDKEFQLFLKDLFGANVYEHFQKYYPYQFFNIMENFRVVKEASRPGSYSSKIDIDCGEFMVVYKNQVSDAVNLLTLVKAYNKKEGVISFDLDSDDVDEVGMEIFSKLSFTSDQMLQFFKPTLEKICKCVEEVISETKIDTIVLVGGYGASPVLAERLRDRARSAFYKAKVIVPDQTVKPQAAIVYGAAGFGLYSSTIISRIAEYTYGVDVNRAWSIDGSVGLKDANWDWRKMWFRVDDSFSIITSKGDKTLNDTPIVNTGYTPLYKGQKTVSFGIFCSTNRKPLLTTERGCRKLGTITVDVKDDDDSFDVEFLFGSYLRVKVTRSDGEEKALIIKLPKST